MSRSRRAVLLSIVGSALLAQDQPPQQQLPQIPAPDGRESPEEDDRLPNGKSRKLQLAKAQHEQALKDATDLLAAAQQLKDELQKAGDYVVPISSVKKTEEIEKLARKIRGRLKE